jgi:hypothetical protein
MAMISCQECKNAISDTAKSCPKCGYLVPRRKVWPWIIGIPLGIVTALMLYGMSIPEYQTRAREARVVCEKISAPSQQYICQDKYNDAIRAGKAGYAK